MTTPGRRAAGARRGSGSSFSDMAANEAMMAAIDRRVAALRLFR